MEFKNSLQEKFRLISEELNSEQIEQLKERSEEYSLLADKKEIEKIERNGELTRNEHLLLGHLYHSIGIKEKSIYHFKKAYKEEIRKLEIYGNRNNIKTLIEIYKQIKREREIKRICHSKIRELKGIKNNDKYLQDLSFFYYQLGKEKEFIKYSQLAEKKLLLKNRKKIRKLENKTDKTEEEFKNLISLYLETRESEKAKECYNQLIEKLEDKENKTEKELENLANICKEAGKKEKAKEYFKQAYKGKIKELEECQKIEDLEKYKNDMKRLAEIYIKTEELKKAKRVYISEIFRLEENEKKSLNDLRDLSYFYSQIYQIEKNLF